MVQRTTSFFSLFRTLMPCIGLVICEIAFEFVTILRKLKHFVDGYTNGRVVSVYPSGVIASHIAFRYPVRIWFQNILSQKILAQISLWHVLTSPYHNTYLPSGEGRGLLQFTWFARCKWHRSWGWHKLCLIPRMTLTSLNVTSCVKAGVPFCTREKTHKLCAL